MVHQGDPGIERLHPTLDPRVRTIDLSHLPRVDVCSGDLSPYISAYRDAIRWHARATQCPVAYLPTMLGDSVGIAAALSLADPELIRVVAWQHSPIPYDTTVLTRYEPLISRFVAVSPEISQTLRAALPGRARDIQTILHGVDAPPTVPTRPDPAGRPLTMVYAGRMENDLKRARSLIFISDELHARGIPYRLTLCGDGPAASEIDRLMLDHGRSTRVRRLSSMPPEAIARLLSEHDLFILPSRVEGLSLSVMEAMAQGCVPIITRTPSGASTLLDPGVEGLLVDVPEQADDPSIARAFTDAIIAARSQGIPAMSRAAHRRAVDRFSLDRCIAETRRVLDASLADAPRRWPTDLPCAFTASSAASGSGAVPRDAASILGSLLARLKGRSIILHGAGRHSLELGAALASSEARIVAFTDDDPKRHGQTIWNWPILAPSAAARTGATDIIISSWMNQDAIWERRSIYERQGLTVHRLYT